MNKLLLSKNKVNNQLILSGVFFLLCMFLDFYITYIFSQGDFTLEANFLARLWWQIFGAVRYIEIPIWITVVLGMAYIINTKSKLLALLWLNFLALNHFFGFLTWLPYWNLDFLYSIIKYDWATGYFISLMSIFVSVPIVLFQLKFIRK